MAGSAGKYCFLLYQLILHLFMHGAKAVSDEDGEVTITEDIFQTPIDMVDYSVPRLWPNRTAIPYEMSPVFSALEKQVILKALRIMERKTRGCVIFKTRTDENDYIAFSGNVKGICDSKVGRAGGKQDINLALPTLNSPGSCVDTGRIQHEVMHALGFDHEHERPDRNQYISVHYDKIQQDKYNDFFIDRLMYTLGIKYDYHSVLQYDAFADAVNGQIPGMLPKRGQIVRMGQVVRMSPSDVAKIALAYKCPLTIHHASTASRNSENFPNFSLEPMTYDQCQLQFNDYCQSEVTTKLNCTRRKDLSIVTIENLSTASWDCLLLFYISYWFIHCLSSSLRSCESASHCLTALPLQSRCS